MLKIDIYIGGTRIDLFKDENIQITDTIQNARDPGSIFTTFSQTFTVPASKTNNKVFKHYYNSRINVGVDEPGFDARFERPTCIIAINGAEYRRGTAKLNEVILRSGKPHSYNINFIGDGADLITAIQDDDLGTLTDLDQYNHDYSLANAKSGLSQGLGLNGSSVMAEYNGTTVTTRSILYPLISHTKRYVYDSSFTAGSTFKLYNSALTAGTEGLEYQQLKPAIKLIHIIEAIEAKYGVTFTRDFFGDAEFTELYMWLNRTKGFIEGVDDNTTYFELAKSTYDTGTDQVLKSDANGFYALGYEIGYVDIDYQFTFSTTITGSGTYDVVIYDENNQVFLESENNTGNQSFVYTWDPKLRSEHRPTIQIISPGTITQIDVQVTIQKTVVGGATPGTYNGTYDFAAIAPVSYVTISRVIPKMTVLDFLKGIFKMFNLTHYKKANGDIYVDTLDNFYALGTQRDITFRTDIAESTHAVPITFDYIAFKHSEPKTFLTKNRFEILNRVFGDADYNLGKVYSGAKYEINTGFSHMMFENLVDQNDNSNSGILFGWAVDEDENPTTDAPLIFYRRGEETITGKPIDWSDETEITAYQSVGNTNSTSAGGKSLNFGEEFDEFHLSANTNSLYLNYYENYVSEVYGGNARLVRYKAYLTPSFMLNYNLYDLLIISGIKHKINSMTINLLDGSTDLELITQ